MKLCILYLCLLAGVVQGQSRQFPDSPRVFMNNIYTDNEISGFAKLTFSKKETVTHCGIMDDQLNNLLDIDIPGVIPFNVNIVRNGDWLCVQESGKMGVSVDFYSIASTNLERRYRQKWNPGYRELIALAGKGFACLNGTSLVWFGTKGDSVTSVPFPYRPLTRDSRLDIDVVSYDGKVYFFRDELACFDPATGSLQKIEIPKKDPRGHRMEFYGMHADRGTGKPFIEAGIYASQDGAPPLRHAQITTNKYDLNNGFDGVCMIEMNNNGWQGNYTYWNLGKDTSFVPIVMSRDEKQHTVLAGLNIVKAEKIYSFEDPLVLVLDSAGNIVDRDYLKMAHKTTNGGVEMGRFDFQQMRSFINNGDIYLRTDDEKMEGWYSVREKKHIVTDKNPDKDLTIEPATRGNVLRIEKDKKNHLISYVLQPLHKLIP